MSYSLALSSTMMSCTVHSPTDSLAQPTCILVYMECNPAPGGSPFELSLGLPSNSRVLSSPPSQSPLVWWFVLGSPWVASPYLSSLWVFAHCLSPVLAPPLQSHLCSWFLGSLPLGRLTHRWYSSRTKCRRRNKGGSSVHTVCGTLSIYIFYH